MHVAEKTRHDIPRRDDDDDNDASYARKVPAHSVRPHCFANARFHTPSKRIHPRDNDVINGVLCARPKNIRVSPPGPPATRHRVTRALCAHETRGKFGPPSARRRYTPKTPSRPPKDGSRLSVVKQGASVLLAKVKKPWRVAF